MTAEQLIRDACVGFLWNEPIPAADLAAAEKILSEAAGNTRTAMRNIRRLYGIFDVET